MKAALSVVAASVVTMCLLAASNAAAFTASAPSTAPATRSDVIRVAMEPQGQVKPQFQRRLVRLATNEEPGTIIIDTNNKYLYLVEGNNRARRYGIGVGRDGFGWSGVVKVGRKAEWPGWTPPSQMLLRRPDLPSHMDGGIGNPLGARAMYLGSSLFRIHGTNEPWTIGHNVSSGCIRMMNQDVIDLYNRVPVGTKVIVI